MDVTRGRRFRSRKPNRALCEYRARMGREFEQVTLPTFLSWMVKRRMIAHYQISVPCSCDDRRGVDCRVYKYIRGRLYEVSFGVTISYASWIRAIRKHPDIPQLYISMPTCRNTVVNHVVRLFKGVRVR